MNHQRNRLVVVASHPIQYYAPLFQRLASSSEVDLHVLYLTDSGSSVHHDRGFGRDVQWDIPLLDGYEFEVLRPGVAVQSLSALQRQSPLLKARLQALRPDFVMVFGYASRMNWETMWYAKNHQARVIYMSDSNYRLVRRGVKHQFKKLLVGSFFSNVNTFLCCGEANEAYLRAFGARESRIVHCPFSIDTERFRPPAKAIHPYLDFIWASKLIEKKRPIDFVRALHTLVSRGLRPAARLVGSGPLEQEVMLEARRLPEGVLEMSGFVNQADIPSQLHQARAFVFTSGGDPYGLAVTEAVAAHLPIISADINGCVGPWGSAQPGFNALTYRAGDVHRLADAMQVLLEDKNRYEQMRTESKRIGPQHDSSVAARIIVEATKAQEGPGAPLAGSHRPIVQLSRGDSLHGEALPEHELDR